MINLVRNKRDACRVTKVANFREFVLRDHRAGRVGGTHEKSAVHLLTLMRLFKRGYCWRKACVGS